MTETDYTNREIDRMFGEIQESLKAQDIVLADIKGRVKETNGSIARATLQIAENKSDVASNWRAIIIGTTMFILLVVPLIGIIYYNTQSSVKTLQNQIIALQSQLIKLQLK